MEERTAGKTAEIRLVRCFETGFPARLKEHTGMPKQLYFLGKLPPDAPSVAIVGARRCTAYGRAKARELGQYLAEHGVAVISGLADGIDGYAHEGALAGGGRTYAVLGSGPDICYPRSHCGLYEAILGQDGGILSEYSPGTPPLPGHFPARNRIISALSDLVVVVEARRRSGSLITADFALEQGKTVLAFPGRQGDPLSEGTNMLIAQGAGIVSSYEAVLWEVWHSGRYVYEAGADPEARSEQKKEKRTRSRKKDEEQRREEENTAAAEQAGNMPESTVRQSVLEAVRFDPSGADALLPLAGGDLVLLQGILLDLVLDGKIEEISPGIYAEK